MPKAIFPAPGTQTYRNAWDTTIKAAEEANDPGRFTAFIGYEWTSNDGGNNLHRNVIFRDDASKASLIEPYTTLPPLGSPNPVDLWKWMTDFETRTGGRMLAIAHNGNLSNGRMFPIIESFTNRRVTREYVETRAKWEPLYEVTQIKGDGEAHPMLSPTDEFANFEIWDKGNLDLTVDKTPDMLEFEYARSGLRNGLRLERDLGTNPVQVRHGRLDRRAHGLAAVEEENFFGKTTSAEPSAERAEHVFVNNPRGGPGVFAWETVASGYAGVWATDNTREALFDAMQRKETYATTGPRMIVRFFGGWEFDDARRAEPRCRPRSATARACRWAATCARRRPGKAPSFLVAALKDPIGANLDRLQIVKGWLDASGETHEQVYDVVVVRQSPSAARTARCRPSATPSTSRTRPGRTRSAHPSSSACGRTRVRSGAARVLLRARARDSDAALDRVRREVLRCEDDARGSHDPAGARDTRRRFGTRLDADGFQGAAAALRGARHRAVRAVSAVVERCGRVGRDEIVVDAPRIAALAEQFGRTWRRPPTDDGARRARSRATCATRCCTAKGSRSASIATTR